MTATNDRPPPASEKELALWMAAVVSGVCYGSLGLPDEMLDRPAVFHAARVAAVKTIRECPPPPRLMRLGRAVLDEYRLQHLASGG